MLAAAVACAAAFVLLLGLAYGVAPAQRLDAAALDGFASLGWSSERVGRVAEAFAHSCDLAPFAVLVAILLAFALLKRGPRHAAAAALLLVGANVSSQVLKPLLAHPRDLTGWAHIEALPSEAFPSGHTTASMSLALAAMLVAPRAYRPLVAAIGLLFSLAVSISLLVLGWHFPSDVVGGQLLAAAWGLLSLAALRAANARWPEDGSARQAAREAVHRPPRLAIILAAVAAVVAVALVVAVSRADALAAYAQRHTAAVAVGAAIVASGMALLAAVTALAARRG
jgi:membrane-associated phospholipid phosphatase